MEATTFPTVSWMFSECTSVPTWPVTVIVYIPAVAFCVMTLTCSPKPTLKVGPGNWHWTAGFDVVHVIAIGWLLLMIVEELRKKEVSTDCVNTPSVATTLNGYVPTPKDVGAATVKN